MTASPYDILVPTTALYLGRLDHMLETLAAHILAHGLDEQVVLDARLQPSMFPLRAHARTAMDFPFRALRQMLERPPVTNEADMTSIAGLRLGISQRLDALASIEDSEPHDSLLEDEAGQRHIVSDAGSFISLYLLPNFFFHLCAVYFTLRILGVPLGKHDFDGFHVYPTDFSFGLS